MFSGVGSGQTVLIISSLWWDGRAGSVGGSFTISLSQLVEFQREEGNDMVGIVQANKLCSAHGSFRNKKYQE